MNKKRQILLSAVLASALASNAQVSINVDASNPGIKVSPNLYGIFFEDINHAADGGLYAELISNRIIQKITNHFANHLKDDNTMVDESIEWIEKIFQIETVAK